MTMHADPDTRDLTMRRFGQVSAPGGASAHKVPLDQLPPGPRWPVLVQTLALMRFRHRFHPWLQRRYGDTFTVNLVPGNRPLVLFTRPEDTKQIFAGDPAIFHAGKGNAILGPVMGEHSLLLTDGDEHHRARKLVMPAFLGHALRGYRGMVADLAEAEVGRWHEGEPFRALDRMNALTLEVILRVVFGVSDEARLTQMRPRVNQTVDINPAILLGWAYPKLQKYGPWRRTVENQVELDRLIYAEIRERRRAGDVAERSDVLSRLLVSSAEAESRGERGLDDVELRDHLVTLLLAGHETTASALAWALFEIGRSPDLLARTQQAVADGDDAWLEAVFKESMRLHPIIPMVVRTLMQPTRVGEWDLPKGATVGPSIIVSHQRDENFPDADVFRPERFIADLNDGQVPALNVWIPFGGGVRRCIGAGFSLMEGVEVLRAVFAAYDVNSVGSDVAKVRNITSVPRRGARINVRRVRR